MLELDDKIAAMAPDLSPDEALAVDSQLDDRALVPVNRPTGRHRARKIWLAVWPKVAAVAIASRIRCSAANIASARVRSLTSQKTPCVPTMAPFAS